MTKTVDGCVVSDNTDKLQMQEHLDQKDKADQLVKPNSRGSKWCKICKLATWKKKIETETKPKPRLCLPYVAQVKRPSHVFNFWILEIVSDI